MIFGSVPLSSCSVECDRRSTAKLIQSSPSGSRRGGILRRSTLSGSNGFTIRSLGKTHPSLLRSGRVAIQVVSLSKISGSTPTSRISFVLVALTSPLYQDRSIRIAPAWNRSPFFNPYTSDSRSPQNGHEVEREPLSFIQNSPRAKILGQRHPTKAGAVRPPRRFWRF